MNKAIIARHLGVEIGQIVSARPEPGEGGLRVLVDYGIGGIKVLHIHPDEMEEPAKASSPVVVVSDKSVAREPVARAKTKR